MWIAAFIAVIATFSAIGWYVAQKETDQMMSDDFNLIVNTRAQSNGN
jgi:hypothetical protein